MFKLAVYDIAKSGEKLNCDDMEDVTSKMADHSKECELLKVKKSLTREMSSQKEDY